jgi:hypothetical protein
MRIIFSQSRWIVEAERVVQRIAITIPRLRGESPAASEEWVGRGKTPDFISIISGVCIVQPGFAVSLVARELLPEAIARVPLPGGAPADTGTQLFAERKIVMSLDVDQTPAQVNNHPRRPEVVRD